jgi:carboxylesterase type B
MESGAFGSWIVRSSWADAQKTTDLMLQYTGCADPKKEKPEKEIKCLEKLPADLLNQALANSSAHWPGVVGFAPVVDGVAVRAPPWDLASGATGLPNARAPVRALLMGCTAEDGGSYLPAAATATDFDRFVLDELRFNDTQLRQLKKLYGPATFRSQHTPSYPGHQYSGYYWAVKHMLRDAEMYCPARRAAKWFSHKEKEAGLVTSSTKPTAIKTSAFLYQFDYSPANAPPARDEDVGAGAGHSSDLLFFFRVPEGPMRFPQETLRPAEMPLANALSTYLSLLLRQTGQQDERDGLVPGHNKPQLPVWEPWRPGKGNERTMVFDLSIEVDNSTLANASVAADLHRKQCEFWDRVPAEQTPVMVRRTMA